MSEFDLILVDTSIWIRFFHVAGSTEARVLDHLISLGLVATCAPIRAEVVSGARSKQEFDRLNDSFDALVALEPPPEMWRHIGEHRFALARRGHQASIVDVMIALTAQAHHAALWTLDEDFTRLSTVIPFVVFRPHLLER